MYMDWYRPTCIMFILLLLELRQNLCKRKGEESYLVSMVSADMAQCGGSWLAERTVDHSGRPGLWHIISKRKDGGWASGGGRGWCEVWQPFGQCVHVHRNLWVVEVLLTITVVRISVPPTHTHTHKMHKDWFQICFEVQNLINNI